MLKPDDFSIESSPAMPPAVSVSKRNDIRIKLALARPTQTMAEEECISTRARRNVAKGTAMALAKDFLSLRLNY